MSESIVNKPWGHYQVIHKGDGTAVKVITIAPYQSLSLQSHEHRAEHWFVLDGVIEVVLGESRQVLQPNDAIDVPVGVVHRITNRHDAPAAILEVQHGDRIDEADIIRYQDRYGRRLGRKSASGSHEQLTPPVTVCEIGCNHKGDIDIAVEMIKVAAQFCSAHVVKFQKRCNRELLSPEQYAAPHPNPHNSYGATYGEHREALEFDRDQHRYLKEVCEDWGVVYSTSVWDVTSVREMASLDPMLLKVPSACNTDLPLLDCLFREYGGQIHISLGMTEQAEEQQIIELAESHSRLGDVVLYHCISGYPVDNDQLSLLEIPRLKRAYGDGVLGIGFSGHHRGIAPDVSALTLGAEYFERHFTLDRSWKGTDHAASLEPNGFRRLARDLRDVASALHAQDKEILDVEIEQRDKLKKFVPLEAAGSADAVEA